MSEIEQAIEIVGENLSALSARLLSSGFLADDANHAAYEKVAASFVRLLDIRTPATLNKSPDNFKAGAEVSSFVQSDAAVIERAASEAIVLIDEINKHAPSRRFNGINQPLHCKLATIRATLARALRSALDAREGG